MAFQENLDVFFEFKDFAVNAKINGHTLSVIFDTPSQNVTIYDTDVEADAPLILCKTHEFAATGAAVNTLVEIEDETYKIKKITRDGTGVSTIYLKT